MSDLVESIFSVRLTPWHGKGIVLEDHPTSAEAIKAAGIDWAVERRKVFFNRLADDDATVDPIEIPNRRALVRVRATDGGSADGVVSRVTEEDLLSVVSDQYQPLQNADAFAFFDPLVKAGEIVYETAGSLMNGKKIWVLARYLNRPIKVGKKDEVRPYLLLLNGHDGSTGVVVQPTGVRTVCSNTLMASLATGMTINFRHVGNVKQEIEAAKLVLERMRTQFDKLDVIYQTMIDTSIDEETIDALIHRVCCPGDWRSDTADLPDEEKITRQGELAPHKLARMQAMERKVRDLLRNGQGATADTYGTVWGVYNALIEFADYYLGSRSGDRANYQLFGEGGRFKQLALQVAAEACGDSDTAESDET